MHVQGHDESLDTAGALVTTTAFEEFQAALKSWRRDLMLALDREMGFWCIVRRDPVVRRLFMGWGGLNGGGRACYLQSVDYVYTPVAHINEPVRHEDGSVSFEFLQPGMWIMRKLLKMHPDHFALDNTRRMKREMISNDRAHRRAASLRRSNEIDARVSEWARHTSRLEPWRFKPSALIHRN